ncbi:hypothetical protein [Sphingobium bisphenolivorans]|uniref:hypothetical protein n=1 Tax=Sphingobium bisphenolivorans TaxID=1335760 RepID=UPI00039CEB69|nr:hypothetical protein [Sphingobium bisphenolivorans]
MSVWIIAALAILAPPEQPPAAAEPASAAEFHDARDGGVIPRRIPSIDIADGCEEGRNVSRRDTVDNKGRRHIRVRVCQEEIEARAERAARDGLIIARAQIAAAVRISKKIKADVLRDLDREIAGMGEGEE